jgi:uncharacterized membrane protein YhhN
MNNSNKQSRWLFTLLTVPLLSGILALNHFGFLFKSGVAGGGILILLYLYGKQLKQAKDVWAIVGAFLFSIGGDWFLSNRNGEVLLFIGGIALFFIAHVGYLTFALMNGQLNRIYTALILGVYLIFFCLMLYPGIDDRTLMIAAFFYLLISCFSLGAAIGISDRTWFKGLYIFGIGLVLFSDTIIALREFAKFKELDFLILPTYYLAQISITASLMVRQRSK